VPGARFVIVARRRSAVITLCRSALAVAALLFAHEARAAARLAQLPGLVREATRVPFERAGGSPLQLEALVTRPDAAGRFPLIVLSHGAPRQEAERATFSAGNGSAVAIEFARRGWAVLTLIRRGYGASDGPFAEGPGPCAKPHYLAAGRKSAEDIVAGMRFMSRQPYVDASRTMLVGISAGGFASLSTAAEQVPGIVAVVNFAGGRGSSGPDTVCSPDVLVDAFGELGKTVRVPSVWFYAENDHYMGPALARRFYERFTAAGGQATFVKLPAFGNDGHFLFSAAGLPLWRDRVDAFLRDNSLPTWPKRVVEAAPALPPPPLLPESAREEFERYRASVSFEKAFATGTPRHYGFSTGKRSPEEAARAALEECAKKARDCKLYAVNNELAR
jgi:dienelactone hydrolase